MLRGRYFEDLQVGDSFDLGGRTVDEAEIIAFARAYDPQPFHLDRAAAERSLFRGLVASGWHTAAIYMRLLVDGLLAHIASLGSPGVDELRWPEPVRPSDTLNGRFTVTDLRTSRSRPEMGIVRADGELRNQAGTVVYRLVATIFVGRRPAGAP